jgi:hypothetical protein
LDFIKKTIDISENISKTSQTCYRNVNYLFFCIISAIFILNNDFYRIYRLVLQRNQRT